MRNSLAGDTQRLDRDGRRNRIGHLQKTAAGPQPREARREHLALLAEGKPLDRQARHDRAQPIDAMPRQIFWQQRGVTDNRRDARKTAAQRGREARLLLERDQPFGGAAGLQQAASQAAGPGPKFQDRAGTVEIDKLGHDIGKPLAARRDGRNPQRFLQP